MLREPLKCGDNVTLQKDLRIPHKSYGSVQIRKGTQATVEKLLVDKVGGAVVIHFEEHSGLLCTLRKDELLVVETEAQAATRRRVVLYVLLAGTVLAVVLAVVLVFLLMRFAGMVAKVPGGESPTSPRTSTADQATGNAATLTPKAGPAVSPPVVQAAAPAPAPVQPIVEEAGSSAEAKSKAHSFAEAAMLVPPGGCCSWQAGACGQTTTYCDEQSNCEAAC